MNKRIGIIMITNAAIFAATIAITITIIIRTTTAIAITVKIVSK